LTASNGSFAESNPTLRVDQACHTAISGRRASRALAEWAKRFGLSEAEFQVLWRLRTPAGLSLDQTALAAELAFSPAQISATVERLKLRGWICAVGAAGDRRRHLWHLTAVGQEVVAQLLKTAPALRFDPTSSHEIHDAASRGQEAAA
jgi:DNA-binding MarR family transcriptional regulator